LEVNGILPKAAFLCQEKSNLSNSFSSTRIKMFVGILADYIWIFLLYFCFCMQRQRLPQPAVGLLDTGLYQYKIRQIYDRINLNLPLNIHYERGILTWLVLNTRILGGI
jgi:hypothetical protein